MANCLEKVLNLSQRQNIFCEKPNLDAILAVIGKCKTFVYFPPLQQKVYKRQHFEFFSNIEGTIIIFLSSIFDANNYGQT